jgi:hypothetical protein
VISAPFSTGTGARGTARVFQCPCSAWTRADDPARAWAAGWRSRWRPAPPEPPRVAAEPPRPSGLLVRARRAWLCPECAASADPAESYAPDPDREEETVPDSQNLLLFPASLLGLRLCQPPTGPARAEPTRQPRWCSIFTGLGPWLPARCARLAGPASAPLRALPLAGGAVLLLRRAALPTRGRRCGGARRTCR